MIHDNSDVRHFWTMHLQHHFQKVKNKYIGEYILNKCKWKGRRNCVSNIGPRKIQQQKYKKNKEGINFDK